MARARNIKPGFFKNELLAELSPEARLLFIGLWTLADRRGRLEDRPRRIKMDIFPADSYDVDELLQQLNDAEFIERYGTCTVQARCKHQRQYIQILKFEKHQHPHKNERESEIPAPDELGADQENAPEQHHSAPADSHDSLNPDSLKTEPNGSDAEASLNERLWGEGLKTVTRLSGQPEQKVRSMLGHWRKHHDDQAVMDAIVRAEQQGVSEPIAWITAALKAKKPGQSEADKMLRGAV